ncbi:MAG: YjgP/YjgQ family permease [Epsilonproteobacteria bacterium]|nr:YjgP/YjgQ family permease [Campylobacterota bacterium]
MDRVNRYLFRSFISLFSSMFFILFSIMSVMFFIKIASVTAVLQINFIELITMFIYLIPKLLIYTMPITFFVSLCITLFNLSKENELIIIFTLGRSPKKVSQFFFIVAALFSILMIINVIVLIPLSKQLNKNFLEYKKAEAKFNIQDSKFGQKFSNWLVYIDKAEKNQTYKNITLYKKSKNGKAAKLILSKKALIQNADGVLRLILENGKAFEFQKDKIEQVNFKKMYINSKHSENIGYIQTIQDYWKLAFKDKSRAYDFAFFILISLFPLTTVLLAIGLSTVTSRYSSNGIYLYIFTTVALYFALVFTMAKIEPFSSILIVSLITMSASYLIYRKRVALRY